MSDPVTDIRINFVHVTEKTIWIFVRLRTKSGFEGVGEATLGGYESAISTYLEGSRKWLIGYDSKNINGMASRLQGRGGAAQAAARSGIEQALWDIQGKRAGMPIHALLGYALRDSIPLYANINRRTINRTPQGFVESALLATANGHRILKIAPFDGLRFDDGWHAESAYRHGISCTRAIVEAVGSNVQVSVDCHWRLGGGLAERFLHEAAELGLFWVECPLPETAASLDDLVRLHAVAQQLHVRLAGLEQGGNLQEFLPFLHRGIFDVIMPDVKWVGGIGPLRDIAATADAHGIATSPHNPSGPVCHAASLHLVSTMKRSFPLEHQFDESQLFFDLCPSQIPLIDNGISALPKGLGLGVTLDEGILKDTSIDPSKLI
ncbi:MAG: mandelate racemase/muconate lactonizing enzyme family protein [Rhodospirillales bacterium]